MLILILQKHISNFFGREKLEENSRKDIRKRMTFTKGTLKATITSYVVGTERNNDRMENSRVGERRCAPNTASRQCGNRPIVLDVDYPAKTNTNQPNSYLLAFLHMFNTPISRYPILTQPSIGNVPSHSRYFTIIVKKFEFSKNSVPGRRDRDKWSRWERIQRSPRS